MIKPNTKLFENIAKTIKSNFFTMDIAKDKNGKFIIIEIGDGQVSGIPGDQDKDLLYKSLNKMITNASNTQ